MRILILLLLVINCVSCQTNRNILNKKEMVQKKDVFDIKKFEKNKTYNNYEYIDSNGNKVSQNESAIRYEERITKKNSKYGTYKLYHKNGFLKEKFDFYDTLSIGDFTSYDENGNVKEVVDLERFYTYTLDDVLIFCKQTGLVENKLFNKKIVIVRTTSYNLSEKDPIVWEIRYGLVRGLKIKDTYNTVRIRFKIDGRTGKEIERSYKRAKKDKKWVVDNENIIEEGLKIINSNN